MSAAAVTATLAERNAANAQYSTGPVTAEGKNRSARNSLRHGLTSRTVVLAHESQEDYDELTLAFEEQYQPGTAVESHMLGRMAACWWKLVRADRVEAEFFAQRGTAITDNDPSRTGDAAFIGIFCESQESRNYRLFLRYYTNAQKSWRTALSEYTETRRARVERQQEEDMLKAMLEARARKYAMEDQDREQECEEVPDTEESETEEDEDPAEQKPAGFVSHPALPPEPQRPVPGPPTSKRY
ncbi:MAG: hypothetical protein SGI92_10025 [Bryobacteraceae bacterium]|nr:hypothetical protein [Bryobacteraceae bacterium]